MKSTYRLSFLASCICLAVGSSQAYAACDNTSPGNGDKVTCSADQVGNTAVVSADGVSGVTVQQDGTLDVSSGPAISLGDSSTIRNTGIISGTSAGILLREGSAENTINNSGSITGTAGPGIRINAKGNTAITNSGNISSGEGTSGTAILFGDGDDTLTVTGGTITGIVNQGRGADTLHMVDGTIDGDVIQGVTEANGDDFASDKVLIEGGTITGGITQGEGIDDFEMTGGTIGSLQQGGSQDTFRMTGGWIKGAFEDGDHAEMTGGRIGNVQLKAADNFFDMSGGSVDGNVSSGLGKDTYIIRGDAKIGNSISTGAEKDSVTLKSGTIVNEIRMSTGDDLFRWEGGSVGGAVKMEADNDRVELVGVGTNITDSSPLIDGGNGDDSIMLDNSQYVHSDANLLAGFEHVDLTNGSTLTLRNNILKLGDSEDDNASTGFSIDSGSTLAIENGAATDFTGHLSGTGTVSTDTSGKAFNFTSNNKADGFGGTLALGNSTLALAGVNTQALKNATLRADDKSITTVGSGQQTIGGLTFNGGTVVFGAVVPGNTVSDNTIQTSKNLDISGKGSVKVSLGDAVNYAPDVNDKVQLLKQDDGENLIKLAGSGGTVTGNGSALTLKDSSGSVISSGKMTHIVNTAGGPTVAEGTWDWKLSDGTGHDGLYVTYALKEVNLKGAGSDALALNSGTDTGSAADLSAKVTGAGDLAITGGTVSLSNSSNDYRGVTDVRGGTLQMNNDSVLGNTSLLKLADGTGLKMAGHTQTVGAVATAAGSLVDIAGGNLTINSGGTVQGHMQGAGTLTLEGGELTVTGANTGLSATTAVNSGATATLDNTQGLGSGAIDNGGTVNLNAASGTFANSVSNSGKINLTGSQVQLSGDNTQFSGEFSIDKDSRLTAAQASHLGSAAVHDEGTLALVTDSDWTLANVVDGSGNLVKDGAGTLTLTDPNLAYTGSTDILSGGLRFGSREAPSTLASSQVNIAAGAMMAANGTVSGGVDNKGTLQVGQSGLPAAEPANAVRAAAFAAASGTDSLVIGGDLSNSGTVQLAQIGSDAQVGNTLTVNGNYAGNGGKIRFNTVLGDDSSLTDHMTVEGDTSGTTLVSVANAGGTGARTLNGIELIAVNGNSAGEFVQDGRIAAGAYDYTLGRGVGAASNKNWYLTNEASEPTNPTDPTDPTNPTDPGDPGTPPVDPGNPTDPGDPGTPPVDPGNPTNPTDPGEPTNPGTPPVTPAKPAYRPEAGSYIANIAAANTMFITRLHDRLGETQYTDALTGEQRVTSLWMRQVGTHNRWKDSSGQLKTRSNQYVIMLGGDVAQWSSSGLDRGHLGLMAGYGNNSSHTHSSATGYGSDGKVHGYNVGIYGTWYANDADKTGLYVDTWASYSWLKNSVNGEDLASESYHSKGFTGSLETGYTWQVGEFYGSKGTLSKVYIQPQAQAIWMGVRAKNHTEDNGTRVSSDGDGNVLTRLGARAYLNSYSKLDEGKQREFQPFIEANWIHNTRRFSTKMDGVRLSQEGARNLGEVKTGVEGKLSNNLTAWGNVGQQLGDHKYSNTEAMLGVKYSW
ncbi:autotransporter outer membrane beta-barrel domain-containing protein [Pluralibacter gergoviae]|uniref:autotransporter outer membrane beta-barrel domain-containing protein n=1 Tax=Pluralibacter gergoviae TaxID=61647 RepID=UPI00069FB317|nr:autotransporter outer membrane beta-barrel domain-containing protein [Pluralibacter gergoviae]